jgi:hypothetical protein
MRIAEADLLIVPGWTNSGPDHWQTRWQAKLSTARRVEQDDWQRPVLHRWCGRLAEVVAAAQRPVILIAHSCGVATVAHAVPRFPAGKVAGAFLAAPIGEAAILETAGAIDPNFAPLPLEPLPFPSLLVASHDDPYCPFEEAGDLALAWGARFVDAGASGHINVASGHGPWPEGLMLLAGLLKKL